MKLVFAAITSVVSALVIASVVSFAPAADAATGSGKIATETRTVSDFEAIALAGSMDITVRQGTKEGLQIQADDNLLPLIETVVESGSGGRTLAIRFKRGENINHHAPIKITVDVIRLTAVAASGSGDVIVEALKTPSFKLALSGSSDAKLRSLNTDALEVRISGSGDIAAAGSARQVKLSIAGSGDADLAGLTADDVSVRIAGSGDASVTANKSLEVSVAGSGDVRYGGAVGAVKSSIAGSGSVTRR